MSDWSRRADRAVALAGRYPASADVLSFIARLRQWQGEAAPRIRSFSDLGSLMPSLIDLVETSGPRPLAIAAREVGLRDARAFLSPYWETPGALRVHEFFARALLELYAATLPNGIECPWCRLPPQVGCLVSQGDGLALQLVCALCYRRRSWPRAVCPSCEESSEGKQAGFTSPQFPHLRLSACDSCQGYLVVVDLARDLESIPEIDELIALPLDLWAAERGYGKLQPNLIGA